MVSKQEKYKTCKNNDQGENNNRSYLSKREFFKLHSNMSSVATDSINACRGKTPHEHGEVLVISFTNACAYPRAVMIKSLDAASTKSTMDGSRRPVNIAGVTVLDLDDLTLYDIQVFIFDVFTNIVQRSVIGTLQKLPSWNGSRVFCGCNN